MLTVVGCPDVASTKWRRAYNCIYAPTAAYVQLYAMVFQGLSQLLVQHVITETARTSFSAEAEFRENTPLHFKKTKLSSAPKKPIVSA